MESIPRNRFLGSINDTDTGSVLLRGKKRDEATVQTGGRYTGDDMERDRLAYSTQEGHKSHF